jgi:MFS family permease
MNNPDNQLESSNTLWAPGTVRLEQGKVAAIPVAIGTDDMIIVTGSTTKAVLQPVPTSDPNDPLNWSSARKTVNFTLVCFYVLWTFVQLSLGFTAWGPLEDELGFTDDQLNSGVAINYGGLALGCIVFIPFIHKYGRRPLYVFSSILQLASVIWQAKTYTIGDYLGSNLISGLGGAISETVVQITIADIFFVHQRAAMSGWYLICVASGSFLGPVASGFIVESQGWRWLWWYCVIFMTINLILVVFFFEESKYVLTRNDRDALRVTTTPGMLSLAESRADDNTTTTPKIGGDLGRNTGEDRRSRIDTSILQKTYFQRIALVTTTPGSIAHYFYQPVVVLFCFPAVTYVAITYGVILASFAIMTAIQSVYLLDPPYNFGPNGIGLMNLAPFLGACIGFAISGFLSDRSIMVLSKRNGGVYEPEMRLWPALVSIMMLPGGILIFGIGLAQVRC